MINKHKIIAIVAVDERWAIGKHKKLLYHIPTDMKYFKECTTNNIVVFGTNTLRTFPGNEPLKNRINILLSRDTHEEFAQKEHCYVAHSIEEMEKIIQSIDNEKDVFICGGALVYSQLLGKCDMAYITKIHASTTGPDAFFPNLDEMKEWQKNDDAVIEMIDNETGYKLEFCEYIRNEKT